MEIHLYYTVYKITNKINQKFYIGKHQTKNLDDGYMGSGKLIRAAIKKYGIENFTKEILYIFSTEDQMNQKEKELVVISEMSYNLCEGGKGGFSYINQTRDSHTHNQNLADKRDYSKTDFSWSNQKTEIIRKKMKDVWKTNPNMKLPKSTKGRKASEEEKIKMSIRATGTKNSQYGTRWVNNGLESKKIPSTQVDLFLSNGYTLGRVSIKTIK